MLRKIMGGSDQCFFDAVVAVDVLTVNNNDMKLAETRTVHLYHLQG